MPTPTPFAWKAGPAKVQVSGDWDGWKERVDLEKQADGSFAKDVSTKQIEKKSGAQALFLLLYPLSNPYQYDFNEVAHLLISPCPFFCSSVFSAVQLEGPLQVHCR